MRTTEQLIIDFNPSDPVHWLYTELIDVDRDDVETWITTYKDNHFLPEELVREIELLKGPRPRLLARLWRRAARCI